jgi:hypothetical protein
MLPSIGIIAAIKIITATNQEDIVVALAGEETRQQPVLSTMTVCAQDQLAMTEVTGQLVDRMHPALRQDSVKARPGGWPGCLLRV